MGKLQVNYQRLREITSRKFVLFGIICVTGGYSKPYGLLEIKHNRISFSRHHLSWNCKEDGIVELVNVAVRTGQHQSLAQWAMGIDINNPDEEECMRCKWRFSILLLCYMERVGNEVVAE